MTHIKKANKQRLIKGLILLVFVAIFILAFFKYKKVNAQYPNPIVEEYEISEVIVHDSFYITVTDFNMIDFSELSDEIKEVDNGYIEHDGLIGQVTIKLKNNNTIEKRVDLIAEIASDAFSTAFNIDLFYFLNKNPTLTLKSEEEIELILPFDVYAEDNFTAGTDLTECKYEFVVSLYPVKKVVKLN